MTTVLKLGGELLEGAGALRTVAAGVRTLASRRVVVVHGGGRAIDAELRLRGIDPRFVDGLRVTDAATLDVVVSVLAGRTNTAFVAALHAAGVRAVGLSGADAGIGLSQPTGPVATTSGDVVDLGFVGRPIAAPVALLRDLMSLGYVPVVSSVGVTADGALLNVNADTLAGHLATLLEVDRLIIAGATAGVIDGAGRTVEALTPDELNRMIASGEAHSGMVAKLTACRAAFAAGVGAISIVDGRGTTDFHLAPGTRFCLAAAAASV